MGERLGGWWRREPVSPPGHRRSQSPRPAFEGGLGGAVV